jgi:serine/threonine protein kinase
MAPEQFNQEKEPIMKDFSKLDVWALGVLLVNLLTLDYAFVSPQDSEAEEKKYL